MDMFCDIWKLKTKEELDNETKEKEAANDDGKNEKKEEIYFNNWVEFAGRFIEAI